MTASQQTLSNRIIDLRIEALRKEAEEAKKLQDYENMFLLIGKADELEASLDLA